MENSRYKFRALFECLTEGTQTWQYLKIGSTIEWHGREQITDWLQCTGLKDKNGVEIYEGDIVEVSPDESYYYGGLWDPIISKIVFTKGSFRLTPSPYSDNGMDSINKTIEDEESLIKVIGNIHENKEL